MLRTLFGRAGARKPHAAPPSFPPPAPDRPVYVVGDIHGRVDLLDRLLERIRADQGAHGLEDAQLVFVGDYVDRGERSRDVLERLRLLSAAGPAGKAVCLLGNHEKMLLDFIDDPAARAGRWLRYGGLQTLASFAVGGASEAMTPEAAEAAAARLRVALGPEMEAWLRSLPLALPNGNLTFVHAGADPGLPLTEQPARTLLWGHEDFVRLPRRDGQWVVHGHTVVDAPVCTAGRVNVDTGAWFSGRLTAARILPGEVRFLTS